MSFAHQSLPGLTYNYSIYAVPAAWLLAMAPLWWAIGKANSADPRAYDNVIENRKIEPRLKGRITRAVAANNNSHTNLPLFAACLAAANAAHVPAGTLHACAAGYLAARTAYNFAYILAENPKLSYLRSLFYWCGIVSCMTLIWKAGQVWSAVPW